METVSVQDGIVYGFKIRVYYIGVVIVGNAIAGIWGEVFAAADTGFQADPNYGLMFVGFIISVVGFVAIFAGFFGAFYKSIADAVAKGRTMAPTEG